MDQDQAVRVLFEHLAASTKIFAPHLGPKGAVVANFVARILPKVGEWIIKLGHKDAEKILNKMLREPAARMKPIKDEST